MKSYYEHEESHTPEEFEQVEKGMVIAAAKFFGNLMPDANKDDFYYATLVCKAYREIEKFTKESEVEIDDEEASNAVASAFYIATHGGIDEWIASGYPVNIESCGRLFYSGFSKGIKLHETINSVTKLIAEDTHHWTEIAQQLKILD